MNALVKHIEFLREQAVAPLHQQASYARGIEQLPRVGTSEAGDVACMLSSSARAIVRQVHRATPQTQEILRDVLKRLSDALQCELEAAGGVRPPHWVD